MAVSKHNFSVSLDITALTLTTTVVSDGKFIHCNPAEMSPSYFSIAQFAYEREKQTNKKPPNPNLTAEFIAIIWGGFSKINEVSLPREHGLISA